jgi:hypothetical protein
MADGVRKISGVIDEIMRDTVIIQCTLPSGVVVQLRLPPALVPSELMTFGAPVWISLETTGGIRAPVIETRAIESQPRMHGQDAIEDWLKRE